MANYTNNLKLTYLNQNQIAKDIVINQNIQVIDNLLQIKAIDCTANPPANPNEGDVYLVNNGATGLWLGSDKNIAIFQNQAWFFIEPTKNSVCYILYWYGTLFYDGYNWRVSSSMPKMGDYKLSAQTADHDNWMLCSGRTILRQKYNQLFNLFNIKFGAGDGSTTFNIPNIIQNTLFQNTFVFYGLV